MKFLKMEGLGNDFVVIEGPREVTTEEAIAWCDRRRGVGADGVLVATASNGGVLMTYRNSDGSVAETCGNGVRCVARLAVDRGWVVETSFVVTTDAGPAPVEVGDEAVRAFLGRPSDEREPIDIAGFEFHPLRLGNPHAVTVVDDCFATPVEAVGPVVEGDPAFPERTNVEFLTAVDRDRIAVRVWERGVGETLASGTGAAAAAVVANALGLAKDKVDVQLAGGVLAVEVFQDGVWTEGPADYVFSGELA